MQLMGESYKELDYEPYIIDPDGFRINWRDMLLRYNEEGNGKVYSGEKQYEIRELLKQYCGCDNDGVEQCYKPEIDLLQGKVIFMTLNINNSSKNTANNEVHQTSSVTQTSSNVIRFSCHLESELLELERILKRFKEDEESLAASHEKEIKQLQREITCLRDDIKELNCITDTSHIGEAKKNPIMGRIKKGWDSFAEIAKNNYYILGFGEKINEIAELIKGIDWKQFLS